MPRRARTIIAGIPLHIIQRGHNRGACYFADADYHCFLEQLRESSSEHGCSIHAYVLMTNHVHLLATPKSKDSAWLMMKYLNQRYVRYVNRKYDRSGTLWEGRFRSCLTQTENYALGCYRYIELNPVRAGIVERPEQYRWSSYSANAHGQSNRLLTPHSVFLALGIDEEERRKRYRELVKSGLDDDALIRIRNATNSNSVLGSVRFEREIAAMLGKTPS